MASIGVYPCYENQFKVGALKTSATTIADMESFSVAVDNGVEKWTPYESEGWQRALMTAKSITISVKGKRNKGDAGNDYVAGKLTENGTDAQGYFGWTFPDGTVVDFTDAIFDVKVIGAADSTNVSPLEFDVISNGKPTVTPPVTP